MKKIYQHPRLRIVAFIESELLSGSTEEKTGRMNVQSGEYNTYGASSSVDSNSESDPLGTGSDF